MTNFRWSRPSNRDFPAGVMKNPSHHVDLRPQILVHETQPELPSLSAYEEWLSGQRRARNCRMTAVRLRRIVIMHRRAESFSEIARLTGGISAHSVSQWFNKLPEEMR